MIKLYNDQQQAVKKIKEQFKKGNTRVLLQMPTGSGKTIVFTHIAKNASAKNKRVLIISHRIELLMQAGGTIEAFGIKPQLVTSETKYVYDSPVTIAMTGTLKNRIDKVKWRRWFDGIDLIIVDEAHRGDFKWLIDYEKKWKLGVTATPLRSGKMPQLSDEYDVMAEGLQVRDLIKLNRLVPDYYLGVPVDVSGVKKDNKGEFANNELFERFNTKKAYAGIVENWIKHANGLCTIVFCVNIQHCIQTAKVLDDAGIGCKFITSEPSRPNCPKKSEDEDPAIWTKYRRKTREYENYKANYNLHSGPRADVIKSWKSGKFPILINAGIAIEGFDHKPTQCVIVYLATTSLNKWLQMCGRGSRVAPGKNEFVLMDFGGNADRLGHYQSNRQWSLTHDTKISSGNTPYKNCPKCDSLIFVASVVCDFCGYEYPEKKEADFIELVAEKTKNKNSRTINSKDMTHRELEIFAQQKAYKSAWIWRTIYANEGEDGLKIYAKQKKYSQKWVKIQVKLLSR